MRRDERSSAPKTSLAEGFISFFFLFFLFLHTGGSHSDWRRVGEAPRRKK